MNKCLLTCLLLLSLLTSLARGQDTPAPQAATPDPPNVLHVGVDLKAPKLIHSVEPTFTDEARRKKVSGKCTISMVVDVSGVPQNVRVYKSIADDLPPKKAKYAAGLDNNALHAVEQYRFEPATFKGQLVPVTLKVEISFRIY